MTPPPPQTRWANASGSRTEDLTEVQHALPVRLIATPRSSFVTCAPHEAIADVLAGTGGAYDHLPVIDTDSHIVGMLDLAGGAREGTVGEQMRSLTDELLIGADAGILEFVTTTDTRPYRLVVAGPGIIGLVTISDLQKLPVRAALFALITHAEITMMAAINRECRIPAEWRSRLSEGRLAKIDEQRKQANRENTEMDALLYTQFCDKITIIKKSAIFPGTKKKFYEEMSAAEVLRNHLAHANDYASSREAAIGVCRTVHQLSYWIDILAQWPTGAAKAGA